MISINTNIAAMSGMTSIARSGRAMAVAMERLATGRRINHGSDDPSGLIVGENLAAEQRMIEKKIERFELETHRLAAADGARSVVSELLTDLNALVVTAANRAGLSDGELEALQIEADSIIQTIDSLSDTSTFNGQRLLEGTRSDTLGRVTRNVENPDGTVRAREYALADLLGGRGLDLITGDLELAQEVVKGAVGSNTGARSAVGNRMNDIQSQIAELQIRFENVSAAKSLIMDADFAVETANLIRARVLEQAAIFTTRIAMEHNAKTALSLLG